MRRMALAIFTIFVAIVTAGCSDNAGTKESAPAKVHQSFLYYSEEYTGENGESIGNLYIEEGKEPEKISGGVLNNEFVFLNDKERVLFIDEDHKLYEFSTGKDKVKLANDVYSFNGNYEEDIVTYQNEESDLYLIEAEGESEKIASEVYLYELVGEDLYYVDMDGDLSIYNISDRQESDLANDVASFQLLSNDGEIVYLNNDNMLYYKNGKDESIKISSEEAVMSFIKKMDDSLVYLRYDDESLDLYATEISGEGKSEKIASEVTMVDYSDGDFYYINDDGNFYKKSTKDEDATKLASDVSDFTMKKGKLYFTDEDSNLYQLGDSDKKEKIASDVSRYNITPDGDVVYMNEDKELFVGDKKVASDIDDYSHYYGNVAFATKDGKLYLMEDMKEKKVIEEDLSDFSTASYQNREVYSNEMSFEDIAGIWKAESDYATAYIQIDKDGSFTELQSGDGESYTVDYAGFQSMNISSEYDSATITMNEDDTLTVTYDESKVLTFQKSSKQEADQYIKDLQLQADKEEIGTLIDGYLNEFADAVNYGYPDNLDNYIDSNSEFYNQQTAFVVSTYESNIREDLIDYHIENVESVEQDTYKVTVQEQFSIYKYEDSTETTSDYKNIYTIKRIAGDLLITNLEVNKTNDL